MSNAAVNRVPEPRLSLVTDSDHRIEPLVRRNMEKQLRHVAGPEHLVHRREMGGALFRVEIRREYASGHTLSPQELACPTRPAAAATTAAAAAAASSAPRRPRAAT